jgi:hypothetical protein
MARGEPMTKHDGATMVNINNNGVCTIQSNLQPALISEHQMDISQLFLTLVGWY